MGGIAQRLVGEFARLVGPWPALGIRAWDGSVAGVAGGAPVLVLRSRRALRHLLWHPGELGLARAFVTGAIDVEGDLRDGLERCWAAAQDWHRPRGTPASVARAGGLALRLGALGPPPAPPGEEARLRGRLHTGLRDRQAIAHHYDLGNRFYRLILDPSMAYSCGYWTDTGHAGGDLAAAQHAKLDLICGKLQLAPGTRMLDVGCGWGSLIVHAAKHYGVHATGVTLSEQQRRYAAKVVAEHGVGDRVTVLRQDYRELAGARFDAVASIEMGEHVGEQAYPAYVAAMRRSLRPGGRLLLQQMSRGERAPGGGPFIERYIAPDMTMRPLHQTIAHLERGGFEVRHVEAMREHYVRTVDEWARRLEDRWEEIVAEVGIRWARVWRLYLAGGALAFAGNRMGVDQVLARY